jgi:predicted SprT family Zn-dependent metalloprotease
MRSLHMPLEDIATLLSTDDPAEVEQYLERYRQRVKGQLEEYERVLERLPTADEWCRNTGKDRRMDQEGTTYRCSFCDKENQHVRRMIAGRNGVTICDECVTRCNDIIATEETKATGTST